MERPAGKEGGGANNASNANVNEDVEMAEAPAIVKTEEGADDENRDAESNNNREGDVQVYVNWAEEAAAARRPSDEPLPENLIQVMGKVFNNDMLVEHILEKIIFSNDRATVRSCRLVCKSWLTALAKLYKKMKKPQFLVNTNKDSALLNDPRPRPMFEQHTLLYEFIRPMTTNVRHEGFMPTFSLTLGPTYFRKTNYTDFVNCLVQCGSSLVELYIHFPKNSGMSFLLPPDISLPSLTTFGVSFSAQSLLGHHFPVPYHHQHDYFPNYCSVHLVQSILNASKTLKNFHFLHCTSPNNPPDLEMLYLPETLTSVFIETPLRDFDLFLKRPLPCLTELRINATIALYPEETIYEVLSKLSPTLKTIWLTGPPATRRSLPIKLPRLEHVTKFYMFKPWEFEEREPFTNFEEVFPNLETLVFANQTQSSFNYLMKGMRSTTVTSFCVCLTSLRPTQPGRVMLHFHGDDGGPPHAQVWREIREDERLRREMQHRIERMRELALRNHRPRPHPHNENRGNNNAEGNNQNQNAGPLLPLPLRQRVLVNPPQRREVVERYRIRERLREMQLRNQVQQQLQQLRDLRERYEAHRRARYRIPRPVDPLQQQPVLARNEERPLAVEDVLAERDRHRPILEIRRVYPPAGMAARIGENDQQQQQQQEQRRHRIPEWLRREADPGPAPQLRVVVPRVNNPPAVQPPVAAAVRRENRVVPVHRPRLREVLHRLIPNEQRGNAGYRDPEEEAEIRAVMDLIDRVPVENMAGEEQAQRDNEGNNNNNNNNANPVPDIRDNDNDGNREANQGEEQAAGAAAVNLESSESSDSDVEVIGQPVQNANGRNQNAGNGAGGEGGDDERDPGFDNVIRLFEERERPRGPRVLQRFHNINIPQGPVLEPVDIIDVNSSDSDDDLRPRAEGPNDDQVFHQRGRMFEFIPIVPPQRAMPRNDEVNNAAPAAAAAVPVAGAAPGAPVVVPPPAQPLPEVRFAPNPRPAVENARGEGANDDEDVEVELIAERNNHPFAQNQQARLAADYHPQRREQRLLRDRGRIHAPRRGEIFFDFLDMRNPVLPPPLPDRPVTMTKDKMQSINLAFPNLVKLTIQVCGPETCGLRYIFDEMRSLQVLKIIVERSLWNIKWDSLFTGIPDDFCEAVKSNSEIWDDVYLTENPASIRNMTKLEELMLLETIKVEDQHQNQNTEERHISDVAFHFGFFKLKALKRLTVTAGFSPSKSMYNRWYEEKGFKIKTRPRTRLDLSYYAEQ